MPLHKSCNFHGHRIRWNILGRRLRRYVKAVWAERYIKYRRYWQEVVSCRVVSCRVVSCRVVSCQFASHGPNWPASRPVRRSSVIGKKQGRIKLFGAPRQWKYFRPLFQAVFLSGGTYYPPQTESNTTPPSPMTEITNIFILYIEFCINNDI